VAIPSKKEQRLTRCGSAEGVSTTSSRGHPKSKFLSVFSMYSRTHLEGNRVKRWIWMISWLCLAVGVALGLGAPRPAWGTAVGPAYAALNADPSPPSSAGAKEPGEGALSFEVEPDNVEIYLDDHYLGKAGELRGRALQGILAGNRLLELRLGRERTFLQIVVPVNGTKIIRLGPAEPFKYAPSRSYPTVELYVTSWCPHSQRAREFLREKGVPFIEYDEERDREAAARSQSRSGSSAVPVAVIGDQVLVGFSPQSYEGALKQSR